MYLCKNCNFKVENEDKFCQNCGSEIVFNPDFEKGKALIRMAQKKGD